MTKSTCWCCRATERGFPTVLLEAMSHGLPLVTTPIRGAVDHLIERENALFVPAQSPQELAEAIITLARDERLRRKMGEDNRRKVRDFAPDKVVQDYLRIFRRVAESTTSTETNVPTPTVRALHAPAPSQPPTRRSVGSCLIVDEANSAPGDTRVWIEATTLRDAGWRVSVVCPTAPGAEAREEVIDGVRIYRHPASDGAESASGYLREYALAVPWELLLTLKAWRRERFDVIQLCDQPDVLFPIGGLFKLFYGTAVILDHHELGPELYEAKFGRRGDCPQGAATGREDDIRDCRRGRHDEPHLRLRRRRKGAHTHPERVFVVRIGPDLGRFTRVDAEPSFRRGRRYAVAYVGLIGKQEGLDGYLRSIDHIVHGLGRDDVHFMIIGDGPGLETLKEMSRQMGLESCLEFTGGIWDDELIRRLSSCDVCVSPDPKNSFTNASTMIKIMEYMALERPIVQYDLKESRFSAGDASAYAAPGDEQGLGRLIVELLEDEPRRRQMGERGRRRVMDELRWEHQAPNLLAAYDLALQISSRRSR